MAKEVQEPEVKQAVIDPKQMAATRSLRVKGKISKAPLTGHFIATHPEDKRAVGIKFNEKGESLSKVPEFAVAELRERFDVEEI